MSHGEAKLTPAGRLLLVERIERQGWPVAGRVFCAAIAERGAVARPLTLYPRGSGPDTFSTQ